MELARLTMVVQEDLGEATRWLSGGSGGQRLLPDGFAS